MNTPSTADLESIQTFHGKYPRQLWWLFFSECSASRSWRAPRVVHLWTDGASLVEPVSSEAVELSDRFVDLGDLVPAVPLTPVPSPSDQKAISQGQPPKPIPGQLRTDAKGQCPGSKHIPISGGCWFEILAANAEECEQGGYVSFKGRCYAPVTDSRRKPPPTSAPPR